MNDDRILRKTTPLQHSSDFETLAAHCSDAVAVCHQERITFANARLVRLLKESSAGALVGRSLESLFSPDDREATMTKLRVAVNAHIHLEAKFSTTLLQPDSTPIVVNAACALMNSRLKDHWLVILTPVGPPSALREMSPAERQQLYHDHRMTVFAELAASLIHQLGQPLTAAWGAAEILAEGVLSEKITSETTRAAGIVLESNLRASQQFRNIWNFVRARQPQFEHVRLDSVLNEVDELVSENARHAGVTFNISVPTEVRVFADHALLKLAVCSLVNRSLTALAGSEPPRSVDLAASQPSQDSAEITISHNGHWLDSETDEIQGTATENPLDSLSVCRRVLEASGGMLAVEPEFAGHGVRYRIIFAA